MKSSITIEIDGDYLQTYTDTYLAQLWHVVQANPAPMQDREAGRIAEGVGREIIRRFLASTPPELWAHQGRHADFCELLDLRKQNEGKPAPPPAPQLYQHEDGRYALSFGPASFAVGEPAWHRVPLDLVDLGNQAGSSELAAADVAGGAA